MSRNDSPDWLTWSRRARRASPIGLSCRKELRWRRSLAVLLHDTFSMYWTGTGRMLVGGLALRHKVRIGLMLTAPGHNVSRRHSDLGKPSGGGTLRGQLCPGRVHG